MYPQIQRILASGVVTNNGPFVQEFERALTARLGVPTVVFSSGMAALIAMLRAVDVAGWRVICPSFTFPATPHAIVMAGGRPHFAEVHPETLTLAKPDFPVGQNPVFKAILGVDAYGICWRPPELNDGGRVAILIDSAPAFGSETDGNLATKRGLAQVFSFHATKPFSTMEGGALCSQDADLIERAKRIRNFGQAADGDCPDIGFNGKMLEICAAIGLKQLDDFGYRTHRRVEKAIQLGSALRDIPGLRVPPAPLGQLPIWTYRPVFVEEEFGVSRDAVVEGLRQRGIETRTYYRACHLLSCYRSSVPLPVTERLAATVISLPVYDTMTEQDIAAIATAFKEIRASCRS